MTQKLMIDPYRIVSISIEEKKPYSKLRNWWNRYSLKNRGVKRWIKVGALMMLKPWKGIRTLYIIVIRTLDVNYYRIFKLIVKTIFWPQAVQRSLSNIPKNWNKRLKFVTEHLIYRPRTIIFHTIIQFNGTCFILFWKCRDPILGFEKQLLWSMCHNI